MSASTRMRGGVAHEQVRTFVRVRAYYYFWECLVLVDWTQRLPRHRPLRCRRRPQQTQTRPMSDALNVNYDTGTLCGSYSRCSINSISSINSINSSVVPRPRRARLEPPKSNRPL